MEPETCAQVEQQAQESPDGPPSGEQYLGDPCLASETREGVEGKADPISGVLSDETSDELQSLQEEFLKYLKEVEASQNDLSGRCRFNCRGRRIDELLKQVDSLIVRHWTAEGGTCEDPFWVLSSLVYAAAAVVHRRVTGRRPGTNSSKRKPPKKRREDHKVSHYRRLLNWLAQEIMRQKEGKKATPRQHKIRRTLMKVVGCLHMNSLLEARERFRSLLKVRATQLKRQKQRKDAAHLNEAYRRSGPSALRTNNAEESPKDFPLQSGVSDFWKGIVGIPGTWDPDDAAIQRWRDDLVNIECSDEYIDIKEAFRGVIKRMKSWRAPGPDCIQAYWWKVFPRASNLLMGLSTRVVNGELEVPQWVVTGQTVLIPKTKEASRPEHYRPIACLNTIYKIITAVMERVLRDHVTEHNILPPEQFVL